MKPHDLLEEAERAQAIGEISRAEKLCRQAVALERSQEALFQLGILLLRSRRAAEALPLLQEAAGMSESLAIGAALVSCLGEVGQWEAAQSRADRLLRSRSSSAQEWLLAGQALVQVGMDAHAETALRKAIDHGGRSYLGLYGLGFVLHRQGRWTEALQAYKGALAQNGDDPGLWSNMAMCEQRLRRYGPASMLLKRAAELAPGDVSILSRLVEVSAMRCAFDDEQRYASQLDRVMSGGTFRGRCDPHVATYAPVSNTVFAHALDMAAGAALSAAEKIPARKHTARTSASRLRIGYLSSDFCDHAVGRLFAGFVGEHDQRHVHVHAYSVRAADDLVASTIRMRTETFRNLEGASAAMISDIIRDDGIDVLVDLNGYTSGGKPDVMASRPARVQFGYLGLVHDHRAPWLDGVILDRTVASRDMRRQFRNDVVDMPGTMFPPAYHDQSELEATWSRKELSIDEDAFLMCSFANAYKIDRQVVQSWAEISRRIPNSMLLLYADTEAATALEEAWVHYGGDRGRLVCVPRMPRTEYLARLRACDLMLDTFRYGGGSTAVDAIMQGLPILTLEGSSPVARMGASLNRFLGTDALIAAHPGDYVARAVAAAGSAAGLRSELGDAVVRSGFKDGRRVAAGLEMIASGRTRSSDQVVGMERD